MDDLTQNLLIKMAETAFIGSIKNPKKKKTMEDTAFRIYKEILDIYPQFPARKEAEDEG